MIDSHAHVGDEAFDGDRAEALARARDAGLKGIVCVGQDVATSERALAAKRAGFPGLVLAATAGLHPHEAKRADAEMARLADLAASPEVDAVGEAGLDFHYDHSPRPQQREVFRWHLALARRVRKPLVVHVREAHREALDDVAAEGADVALVIHCFTGTADEARAWLDRGARISFSGIVTFKNGAPVREASRLVPADRILVETDSPLLAPVPHRGRRCEPAFLTKTLESLAAARGESFAAFADRTAVNAREVFFRAR